MNEYQRQVELLIKVLPSVAEERDFALHGGTAINLFIRDMPRLSIDRKERKSVHASFLALFFVF